LQKGSIILKIREKIEIYVVVVVGLNTNDCPSVNQTLAGSNAICLSERARQHASFPL